MEIKPDDVTNRTEVEATSEKPMESETMETASNSPLSDKSTPSPSSDNPLLRPSDDEEYEDMDDESENSLNSDEAKNESFAPGNQKKTFFHFRVSGINIIEKGTKNRSKEDYYKCHICNNSYQQKFSLQRHFMRNHIDPKYLSPADLHNCNIAQGKIPVGEGEGKSVARRKKKKDDNADYVEDNKSGIFVGLYRCNFCHGVRFEQEAELKAHYSRHANENREEFNCSLCSDVFSNKIALSKHISTHNQTFSCKRCKLDFTSNSDFAIHLSTHGSGKHCKYCNKEFSTPANRKRHENIHEGGQGFTCKHCLAVFENTQELEKHIKKKHSKSYMVCPYCPKVGRPELFSSQSLLSAHISSKHPGAPKKIPEQSSSKSVPKQDQLNSESSPPKPGTSKIVPSFPKAICSLCKMAFPDIRTMLKHKSIAHKKRALPGHKNLTHKKGPIRRPDPKFNSEDSSSEKAEDESKKGRGRKKVLCKKRTTYKRKAKQPPSKVMKRKIALNKKALALKLKREQSEFYLNLAQNIADNLLNHVDGKASQLSIKNYTFNDESVDQRANKFDVPWSAFNFPEDFDVSQALQKRGKEIKVKTPEEQCLFATGLCKIVPPSAEKNNSELNEPPHFEENRGKTAETIKEVYDPEKIKETNGKPEAKELDSDIVKRKNCVSNENLLLQINHQLKRSLPINQRKVTPLTLEEKLKMIDYEVKTIVICTVCQEQFSSDVNFEEHCINNHPNIEVSCLEIEGDKKDSPPNVPYDLNRPLCPNSSVGALFSCSVPLAQPSTWTCTKCNSVFLSAADLHVHIVSCGGKTFHSQYRKRPNKQKRIKHTMKHRIDLSVKRISWKKKRLNKDRQIFKTGSVTKASFKCGKDYFSTKNLKTAKTPTVSYQPKIPNCFYCKRNFATRLELQDHYAVCTKSNPKGRPKNSPKVTHVVTQQKIAEKQITMRISTVHPHQIRRVGPNNGIPNKSSIVPLPAVNGKTSNAKNNSIKIVLPVKQNSFNSAIDLSVKPSTSLVTPISVVPLKFGGPKVLNNATPLDTLQQMCKNIEGKAAGNLAGKATQPNLNGQKATEVNGAPKPTNKEESKPESKKSSTPLLKIKEVVKEIKLAASSPNHKKASAQSIFTCLQMVAACKSSAMSPLPSNTTTPPSKPPIKENSGVAQDGDSSRRKRKPGKPIKMIKKSTALTDTNALPVLVVSASSKDQDVPKDLTKSIEPGLKQDSPKPIIPSPKEDLGKSIVTGVNQDLSKSTAPGDKQDLPKSIDSSIKQDLSSSIVPIVKQNLPKTTIPSVKHHSSKSIIPGVKQNLPNSLDSVSAGQNNKQKVLPKSHVTMSPNQSAKQKDLPKPLVSKQKVSYNQDLSKSVPSSVSDEQKDLPKSMDNMPPSLSAKQKDLPKSQVSKEKASSNQNVSKSMPSSQNIKLKNLPKSLDDAMPPSLSAEQKDVHKSPVSKNKGSVKKILPEPVPSTQSIKLKDLPKSLDVMPPSIKVSSESHGSKEKEVVTKDLSKSVPSSQTVKQKDLPKSLDSVLTIQGVAPENLSSSPTSAEKDSIKQIDSLKSLDPVPPTQSSSKEETQHSNKSVVDSVLPEPEPIVIKERDGQVELPTSSPQKDEGNKDLNADVACKSSRLERPGEFLFLSASQGPKDLNSSDASGRESPTLENLVSSVTQNIEGFDDQDDEKFVLPSPSVPLKNRDSLRNSSSGSLNFQIIIPRNEKQPGSLLNVVGASLNPFPIVESSIAFLKNIPLQLDKSKVSTENQTPVSIQSAVLNVPKDAGVANCEKLPTSSSDSVSLTLGSFPKPTATVVMLSQEKGIGKPRTPVISVAGLPIPDPKSVPSVKTLGIKKNATAGSKSTVASVSISLQPSKMPDAAENKKSVKSSDPSKRKINEGVEQPNKKICLDLENVQPETPTPKIAKSSSTDTLTDSSTQMEAQDQTEKLNEQSAKSAQLRAFRVKKSISSEKSSQEDNSSPIISDFAKKMKEKFRMSFGSGSTSALTALSSTSLDTNPGVPSQTDSVLDSSISSGPAHDPNPLAESNAELSDSAVKEESDFNEDKKEFECHVCPYCFLEFAYLTNFRRHLKMCPSKPTRAPAPPVSSPGTMRLQHLPKKDEVEGSMLHLLRNQSRQSQMIKDVHKDPETFTVVATDAEKKFQKFVCEDCHKIYLSLFKLMQHRMKDHLMGTESKGMMADHVLEAGDESLQSDAEEHIFQEASHTDGEIENELAISIADDSAADPQKLDQYIENTEDCDDIAEEKIEAPETQDEVREDSQNEDKPEEKPEINESEPESTEPENNANQTEASENSIVPEADVQDKSSEQESAKEDEVFKHQYKELLDPSFLVLPKFGKGRGRKKKDAVEAEGVKEQEKDMTKSEKDVEKSEEDIREQEGNERKSDDAKETEKDGKESEKDVKEPETSDDLPKSKKTKRGMKEKTNAKLSAFKIKAKKVLKKFATKQKEKKVTKAALKNNISEPSMSKVEVPIKGRRGRKPKGWKQTQPEDKNSPEAPVNKINDVASKDVLEKGHVLTVMKNVPTQTTSMPRRGKKMSPKSQLITTINVPKGKKMKFNDEELSAFASPSIDSHGTVSFGSNLSLVKETPSNKPLPNSSAGSVKVIKLKSETILPPKATNAKGNRTRREAGNGDSSSKSAKQPALLIDYYKIESSPPTSPISDKMSSLKAVKIIPKSACDIPTPGAVGRKPSNVRVVSVVTDDDSESEDGSGYLPRKKVCPICKKRFLSTQLRNRHVASAHPRKNNRGDIEVVTSEPVVVEEKPESSKGRSSQRQCIKPLPPMKRKYQKTPLTPDSKKKRL